MRKIQTMKRKFSQTNPKNPLPVRISFPAEIQNSDNRFNATKADEPKTSEYAFFKKLKTNAGRRSKCPCRDKEEIGSKLFRSSDCSNIERNSGIKNSFKDLGLPVEDKTCVTRGPFFSPVVKVDLKRAATNFGDTCSTRKSMAEYSITGRPAGSRNQHEDLFSTKRQKLYQWVTDISFPEIEELCSKGYDFVSVLLSRLFPNSNEENSFKIQKSGQVERNTKSNLHTSPHSNIHLKKLHHTSTRNFAEVECDPYLENGILSCWLDSSRERALINSDSPTCHVYNTFMDYNIKEPSCEVGEVRNTISWIENNPVFSFSSRNYEYFPSSHLKELDDFQYPDDSLLGREQHPLLLRWDSQNVTNEGTSTVISQNTELITYPTHSTSLGNNHGRYLDDGFEPLDASRLCVSSVICKYRPNFYSIPPSPSTSYCKHEFESNFVEDHNEGIRADLSHYPLALSDMTNYLCLAEDFNNDTTYKGSTALLSPGNHHWFSSKVSSEWHHDVGTEALPPPELDFYLERKCVSIKGLTSKHYAFIDRDLQFHQKEEIFSHFRDEDKYEKCLELDGLSHIGVLNHFSKDMVDIRDGPSCYFQMSVDKHKAYPLLIDRSSWDETEGEIYHDDSEFKCI